MHSMETGRCACAELLAGGAQIVAGAGIAFAGLLGFGTSKAHARLGSDVFLAYLLVFALATGSLWLWRTGKRLRSRTAEEIQNEDSRPPVLTAPRCTTPWRVPTSKVCRSGGCPGGRPRQLHGEDGNIADSAESRRSAGEGQRGVPQPHRQGCYCLRAHCWHPSRQLGALMERFDLQNTA